MRTQEEIERDSLQRLIREAYILAKYMNKEQIANLLENAFNLTRDLNDKK
jgi:predicted DNA-binding protein (MmcQ/YjbR family)